MLKGVLCLDPNLYIKARRRSLDDDKKNVRGGKLKGLTSLLLVFLVASSVSSKLLFSMPKAEIQQLDSLTGVYAGGSNPGIVYKYAGGSQWDIISPSLGFSVLSLVACNGKLYAGAISAPKQEGVGQVYRYDGIVDDDYIWTLVGDNLDAQVASMIVWRHNLYVGTVPNGKLLRYDEETESWTEILSHILPHGIRSLHVWGKDDALYLGNYDTDTIGRYDGENFEIVADYGRSCIWDFAPYDGNLYAGAWLGVLYETSDGENWNEIWRSEYSRNFWAVQDFKGKLYVGMDWTGSGNQEAQLWTYNGSSFELFWTTSVDYECEGILSLATDGEHLLISTGGESAYYGLSSGTGRVYLTDGANVQLISGTLGAGIQSLYYNPSPKEQLIQSLNLLNSTICDCLVEATRLTAGMRAKALGPIIDPAHIGEAKDAAKLLLSIVTGTYDWAALNWVDRASLTTVQLQSLHSSLNWIGAATDWFGGIYLSGDVLIDVATYDISENFFRDLEAFSLEGANDQETFQERTDFYYDILMGISSVDSTEIWPRIGCKKQNWMGINELLSHTKNEYENFLNRMPESLPSTFDLNAALRYLNNLRFNLVNAKKMQCPIWFINATKGGIGSTELGGLHALSPVLLKAIEEVENYDTWNTIFWAIGIAARLLKLAFAVPTAGASLLVNIAIGAVTLAGQAYTGAAEFSFRLLAHKCLVDSIAVLCTEVNFYREILSETTKFVNGLLDATTTEKPSIEIQSVVVPNVETSENFGSSRGSVKIRNIGIVDANVTAIVSFVAKNELTEPRRIWMQTVDFGEMSPNQERELEFDYTVPRTIDLKCTGYEVYVTSYAVHNFAYSNTGYPVFSFWVGEDCGCATHTVLYDEIVQGESASTSFISQGYKTDFTLYYGGSDIDLHVYDSMGRHVGINYRTGQIEIHISGARYTGPYTNPEQIIVPDSEGKEYLVEVTATHLLEAEKFSITATEIPQFPALLTTIPSKIKEQSHPGNTTSSLITFIEYGLQSGFSNITLEPSDLVSSSGGTISSNFIWLEDKSFSLLTGDTKSIRMNVSVPQENPAGDYHGNLTIHTVQGSFSIPIAVHVVSEGFEIFKLITWVVAAGLGSASSFVGYLYLRARKQLKKIRQRMAQSVTCGSCKTLNSSGAKFCRKCGKPL